MTSGDPPLPAVLRAIGKRLEAERHRLRDAPRAADTAGLDELADRMAHLRGCLVSVLGDGLVPAWPTPQGVSAVSADQAVAVGSVLAAAESFVRDANRRRASGVMLMMSGDLSALDRISALRDEAMACARAGFREWQRAGAMLAHAPPEGVPSPPEPPRPAIPVVRAEPDGDVTLRPPGAMPDPQDSATLRTSAIRGGGGTAPPPGLRRILADSFRFGEDRFLLAGRYEIRDLIGRGSFGVVLEAFDRALGRLVAVKVMDIPQGDAPETLELHERFRREARAVGRLSHPGIVPVHDFGEGPDGAWIVMELVIGETLQAALRRDGPVAPAVAGRIAIELLDALGFAHGRGIVHRDVKPANVLLSATTDDDHGAVRLVDFGVARLGDSQSTIIGEMIGTLSTMSPEQVRGEPVDHRADLWAVGVVLYQMLTGTRPFTGESAAVIHAILAQDPTPPSAHLPAIPASYDAVIRRALAKAADHRFSDAAEFVAALRQAGRPPPEETTRRSAFRLPGGDLARTLQRRLMGEC